MEDYKQKYENALKVIAQIRDANHNNKELVDFIEFKYPELKDSEDERIGKEILSFLKEFERDHYRNLDFSSWIAWLEKQGEQKPAWSEDDEIKLKVAVAFLKHPNTIDDNKGIQEKVIDWLQSLKERYTWKPSDEQMEALLKLEEMHVLEHEKNQENAHLYMVIKSLREQLLKLKKGE